MSLIISHFGPVAFSYILQKQKIIKKNETMIKNNKPNPNPQPCICFLFALDKHLFYSLQTGRSFMVKDDRTATCPLRIRAQKMIILIKAVLNKGLSTMNESFPVIPFPRFASPEIRRIIQFPVLKIWKLIIKFICFCKEVRGMQTTQLYVHSHISIQKMSAPRMTRSTELHWASVPLHCSLLLSFPDLFYLWKDLILIKHELHGELWFRL